MIHEPDMNMSMHMMSGTVQRMVQYRVAKMNVPYARTIVVNSGVETEERTRHACGHCGCGQRTSFIRFQLTRKTC
eukprot:4508799-Prymnesium_polylepis.1